MESWLSHGCLCCQEDLHGVLSCPEFFFFFFKPKSRFTAKLESLDSSDISPAPHVLAFPIVNIPYQGDTLVITDEPT